MQSVSFILVYCGLIVDFLGTEQAKSGDLEDALIAVLGTYSPVAFK